MTEEYCPNCGGELESQGDFGRLASHQDGKVIGHIYKCPNTEGFEDKELEQSYLDENPDIKIELQKDEAPVCNSAVHNGFFHKLKGSDWLTDGYPC